MSESATTLTYGLIIGTVFGIALTILLGRLAGKVRGLGRLFGRDAQARRLAELEKENVMLKRRLEEKDGMIRKAMESMVQETGRGSPPASDSGRP